ncbi:MAG: serine/threonine protein kinase [Spirulina sp.]
MTYPDFTNYGYQIVRELGHNRAGGRVTYLATELNSNCSVVVKQFQFARTATQWSEYQAYEQEIKILKNLNYPQIPRYIDSFPTVGGFCMIQEYKNAQSLSVPRQWTPQEIKRIAISVLEILQYLHTRIPPIIHRDLKPENILIDDQMNVYLVDFGFARIGGGEVAASSVVKGTLGFMPPEQMFNRQLSPASDLYSLGATLICLLTETPSVEIGRLMDEMGRIRLRTQKAIKKLHPLWLDWLEKMVVPQAKNRYASAEEALECLVPLPLTIPRKVPVGKVTLLAGFVASLAMVVWVGLLSKSPDLGTGNIAILATEDIYNGESVKFEQDGDRIVFEIDISDLKNTSGQLASESIEGTCQILDGVDALVGLGQSRLVVNSGQLKTWCPYEWSGEEQAGVWTFQFFVNGKLAKEKKFSVYF